MRLLIDHGADVDKADKDGETPLFRATISGHLGCARLLIEKGADVDKAHNNGMNPLHVASHNGHRECARLLIESGANVDEEFFCWTPLRLAFLNDHIECARLLIKRGAVVDEESRNRPFFTKLVTQGWIRVCLSCGRCATKMPKCSRCQDAWYCNAECMTAGWPAHKALCKRRPL